ncbi:GlxA family transcriptional regulator [Catellatospora tritici]|uniref:GlxA family transcriptional regulator n=1 Tax=Catellatospora tritici TaxID=2851566 RepID=UPI001C2DDA29|nr:helix-turn-helix domain-containing protein [Catellatospora tritici]MBV1853430.1 helix-turn-helix domain-containing protein [Catellatospora tritici]
MLTRVAVLALDQIAPFELGVLCEVFGTDRTADGFPGYEFAVCSVDGGPVRTRSGFLIEPHADLAPLATADLIAVPAHPLSCDAPPAAVAALRTAAQRGAWVMAVCSGAFLLGQAGLLDGRRCTTHWNHAALLRERYPTALVVPDELYVQDGKVITSAGTAAGIDACLHLVRQVHGSVVATKLARRMVVPPHRAGGQSQFIEAPIPDAVECETLQPLLEWLLRHLEQPLTVDDLAGRTHMAPRTFARKFRAETGATPHDWITHQRVLLARRLLEETELTVESVAARAGFGDSATLRHHFNRRLGTTPLTYRQTFRIR